jgi:hypothetical protein
MANGREPTPLEPHASITIRDQESRSAGNLRDGLDRPLTVAECDD